ncbi:MAG: 1-(5-phosphoribosyl)-5-amino-4-imidazole-carboxylate carboxylase [Spirochaetes bacterium GWF1_51_8]|nr:MAG: 1-(5-phosphoribosyl)-5-amino-4-imidazole-carboxylate carboxylase [Spirochaetes bacterium GWF1_51_8]
MDKEKLRGILGDIRDGKLGIDEAMNLLRRLPYADLGFARLDTHRALRQGFPEVVFCQGKTVEQIVAIFGKFADQQELVIGTRAGLEVFEALKYLHGRADYFETARIVTVGAVPQIKTDGPYIAVVSAGTSDIPVAEEAAVTAELLGCRVVRIYDVGVAGVHRLLEHVDLLLDARAVVAVAGMEGALASVIGGIAACPVIAVPTSVGYGASFQGIAALLSMLNSCAPGVSVVNIDNGFGAGFSASMIFHSGGEK